jgi:hypothetical protein
MSLLSKSGRVLVIDDMIDEVQPIMRVLSKNGVKYSYFTGEHKEFPNEKFFDIRLVFLDLYLTGNNREINFEQIMNTFKGIFDETNGPIIIILWTSKPEDFHEFIKYYCHKIRKPEKIAIVPLDKTEYFERDEDGYYVPKYNEDLVYRDIIDKILETVPDNHWFHVHTFWDDIITKASVKSINNFLTVFPDQQTAEKPMWSLILSLAFAYSGDNLNIRDKDDVVKSAMMSYNMVFFDELENLTLNTRYFNQIPDMKATKIVNQDIAAKIHKKIHIGQNSSSVLPGTVVINSDENMKFSLLKENLRNGINDTDFPDIWKTSKSVICEISPMCDCFSNKWRKHRITHGILHQAKFNKKFNSATYLYSTIPFEFDSESYQIQLDFRFLDAVPLDYFEDDVLLLRLRQSILSEIQTKCSAHVNRSGVISITPKDFKAWLEKPDPNP